MLGKNIYPIIFLAVLMVAAPLMAATPNHINRLELTHEDDFTIVTIYGRSALKTVHQSVEAKEGKPFRIVVDCLPARHNLQNKNFTELPSSVITGIRTSQYTVNPEEVVRIVLDLSRTSIYRVDELDNKVKIYVSDPDTKSFATWSSTRTAKDAPKKADSKLAVVNQTLPVTGPAKTVTSVEEKPVTVAKAKPTSKSEKQKVVVVKDNANKISETTSVAKAPVNNEPANQVKVENKIQTVHAKTTPPAPKYTVAKLPAPDAAMIYGPFPTVKPAPPVAQVTKPAVDQKKQKDQPQVLASADPQKDRSKTGPIPGRAPEMKVDEKHRQNPDQPTEKASTAPKTAPPTQPRPVTIAQVDDNSEPVESVKAKKAAASRYRRENAKSLRMKQTQVVEFPQRIVIKYSSSGLRDPFKTMIDEEVTGRGSFVSNRLPNIETLYLVGILKSGFGKSAALLEDIDGIGYILKPGDRIQNGYVSSIADEAVQFQINEYGWTRTVTRKMQSTESN